MDLKWHEMVDLWVNTAFVTDHWSRWSQYKAYNIAYHNSEQVYELGLEPVFNGY